MCPRCGLQERCEHFPKSLLAHQPLTWQGQNWIFWKISTEKQTQEARAQCRPEGSNMVLQWSSRSGGRLLWSAQSYWPQTDGASQSPALPAALSNTRVKKIKDPRSPVRHRMGLCTRSLIHTQKEPRLMSSASGAWEKREMIKNLLPLKKNVCRNINFQDALTL